MLNSVMTLCLTVTLGQAPVENNPYPDVSQQDVSQQDVSQQAIGEAMGSVDPGLAPFGQGEGPGGELSAGLTGSIQEELYPYDSPEPWIHGYWQEIPAYGGFAAFRPYNYKHVLSQSQAAGGWGMSAQMPYSQQFWHRYQQRAEMRTVQTQPARRYTNQLANWQAPVSRSPVQQTSARTYRQPVRSIPTQPRLKRSTPRRQSNNGFSQRLAAAEKKQKSTTTKKKSFWKRPFFK